jgi:hypothetical protein
MLGRFFTKKPLPKSDDLESIKLRFFAHPEHQWISTNAHTKRVFSILFDCLKSHKATQLFAGQDIIFITCSEGPASALASPHGQRFVLIFPELIGIINSALYLQASAILAHELGHLFHRHIERGIRGLTAQVEADAFACAIGLGEELAEYLNSREQTNETKERLYALSLKSH